MKSSNNSNRLFHKIGKRLRPTRSGELLSGVPTPTADDSPVSPALKDLPAYTPVPVPERKSSAKREATDPEQQTQPLVPRSDNPNDRPFRHNFSSQDADDISLGLSGFDDDLLRPASPVSPMGPRAAPGTAMTEDSVTLPHRGGYGVQHALFPRPTITPYPDSHNVIRQPTPVQEHQQPRGRTRNQALQPPAPVSKPPTPAPSSSSPKSSSAKDSMDESYQHLAPKVLSPPESIKDYAGPEKLGSAALAQLQVPSADKSDCLETELSYEDDPNSWDIIKPNQRSEQQWDKDLYSLEKRAEQLYSAEHLHLILEDADFHAKFAAFLHKYRPWRAPLLSYYLDACKALKALQYTNALTEMLAKRTTVYGNTFQPPITPPGTAANNQLKDAAQRAFDALLSEDLHWYIAHTYIGIVCSVMRSRVTGNLPAPLREASHGLAEVFCITDPTRRDNPIVLASPAFTRHSGCNMDYILGRNCRFMQGPGSTVDSCRRFAVSMEKGVDHSEIFVNYRRDGSPFLSLVMNALLTDSHGNIRYYLGAQVDVSGLLKNCTGLDSLTRLVEKQAVEARTGNDRRTGKSADEAMRQLSQMLNGNELDIVSEHGGLLQKDSKLRDIQEQKTATLQHANTGRLPSGPPRVLIADGSSSDESDREPEEPEIEQFPIPVERLDAGLPAPEINLSGVYKYYLLVRPAPSLRVLFASPTLRFPGVIQSHFLHRIGSSKMRNSLNGAFQEAKVITAKVKWLKSPKQDGDNETGDLHGPTETRWIHCTPLMHHTGAVGLWMIVVVMPSEKDEDHHHNLNSKASRGLNHQTSYQSESQSQSQSGQVRQDRVPSRMVSYQSEGSSSRRDGMKMR